MTIESDLRDAFNRHMDKACSLYPNLSIIRNRLRFTIMPNIGQKAGVAIGASEIRVNLAMAKQNFDHIANDTIPHEIAHIICDHFKWDNGHGRMWKRVAASLGIVPNRCFSTADTGIKPVKMRQRTQYLHRATCGTEIWLSDVMHGKIMKGSVRVITRTGGKLNASTYMWKMK